MKSTGIKEDVWGMNMGDASWTPARGAQINVKMENIGIKEEKLKKESRRASSKKI